ncbi:MAG: alkaline phosphatase [Pseudomonadales bacterium]
MIRLLRSKLLRCAGILVAVSGCAGAGVGAGPAPQNVILFLGDGMGVSTVTAARILAGQQAGQTGEEHVLSFETFPNVALVKTYNTDAQVADSAGTMSAIMTGEKTRIGVFGIRSSVSRDDCAGALANELPTLLEEAEDRGLPTGVISTTRITHATPGATYAHVPNRNWEADVAMPAAAREAGCRDIARQLVEFDHGDGIEVVLGGGRAAFLPKATVDPEYPQATGARGDGQNLVTSWLAGSDDRHFVWNRTQLNTIPTSGQVLGLFEPSHMQYEADRDDGPEGEPSIAEMTAFAVRRLARISAATGKGYFLMVEGGRIDHAHHDGNAYRSLNDAIAMADAVQVAMDLTSESNTLIVVTADHSHTLTISGYPRRGNPILGKVETAPGELATDAAGRPYTTLSYANGPGYREALPDLTDVDTLAPDFLQPATFPLGAETHGGEDVAAYGRGPNADRLRGVIEQNVIYDIMRGALFP